MGMLSKTYFVVITLLTFQVFSASAQKWSEILTPEELAKQKEVLVENFPNVFQKEAIEGIRRVNVNTYRVYFNRAGTQYEAFVSSGVKGLLLIETDQLISNKNIPDVVKAGFSSGNYKTWHIDKAFIATTPYSGVLYRLDIYNTDKSKVKRIYFNDEGYFHNEPPK